MANTEKNNQEVHAVHPGIAIDYSERSAVQQQNYQSPEQSPSLFEQPEQQEQEPQEQQAQEVQQEHIERVVESNKENFRAIKQKNAAILAEKARIAYERDQYAYELQKLKQENEQRNRPVQESGSPDDLVERKYVNTYVDSRVQQLERQLIETRIKSQFPDFDSVVCAENIALLKKEQPEIAATLNASTDLYATAVSAYKLIKKMIPTENYDESVDNLTKLQQNSSKPRSSASTTTQRGDTPLTRANTFANGFTKEAKDEMFREMKKAQKNSW